MRKTTTAFEQRWSLWLSGLSGVAVILSAGVALWMQSGTSGFSALPETTKESLLSQYNDITHGGFIAVLAVLAGLLIYSAIKASEQDAKPKIQKSWKSKICYF